MLGQKTFRIQPFTKRLVYRFWGVPDINARQKWKALWPHLRRLDPAITLLDAGCGQGLWALELAARFPQWRITALDKDEEAIQAARAQQARLGLTNVEFIQDDFLTYKPSIRFDAVLSVASAHYLVEDGEGEALFTAFHSWLKPNGKLLMLGPRHKAEVPITRCLPPPTSCSRSLFTREQLIEFVNISYLELIFVSPVCYRLGTLAKQLSIYNRRYLVLAPFLYLMQILLDVLDRPVNLGRPASSYYMLIAKPRQSTTLFPDGKHENDSAP